MAINEGAEERGCSDLPVIGTWDTAGGSMSAGVIFELVLTQEGLRTRKTFSCSDSAMMRTGPRPYQLGAVQRNGRKPKCCWRCSMACPD